MLFKVVGDKRVPKISSEMYFFWTIHCHQVVELSECKLGTVCLGLSHLTVLVPELLTLQLTQCAQLTSLTAVHFIDGT